MRTGGGNGPSSARHNDASEQVAVGVRTGKSAPCSSNAGSRGFTKESTRCSDPYVRRLCSLASLASRVPSAIAPRPRTQSVHEPDECLPLMRTPEPAESTADISGCLPICRWRVGRFACWSWRAAFVAIQSAQSTYFHRALRRRQIQVMPAGCYSWRARRAISGSLQRAISRRCSRLWRHRIVIYGLKNVASSRPANRWLEIAPTNLHRLRAPSVKDSSPGLSILVSQ